MSPLDKRKIWCYVEIVLRDHTTPVPPTAEMGTLPTSDPAVSPGHVAPSLSGLHRRSLCCSAPVIHPYPLSSHTVKLALTVACGSCGQVLDDSEGFEVVNDRGERIWPVPEGFDPEKTQKRRNFSSDSARFRLHIDSRLAKFIYR